MDVLDEKKQKKKAIRERNKRDFRIFTMLRQKEIEQDRIEGLQEALAPAPVAEPQEVLWSAKTQEIRNRLTDKKRMSKERWNRFAATSDSGGRGL